MSETHVTLTIDGVEVIVPKGTLLVDAAKKVGIEIPVFCYHPKLKPAGMCRMCLVEIGRPARDRSTGEAIRDEHGQAVIQFGPKLETACTTYADDGWVVRVNSENAIEARRQIIEFLLTSHPLDCPICDKGGECSLQDQTMKHGPGESRFLSEDKMHLGKAIPLGDMIFLDQERCIQCGRCIRFQEEIVDDPVIEFSQRGRQLQIVSFSDPPFNSYFSGNATDICPVGALTTADFRFGARPWELNSAASICPHCPVGCNIMLNVRREAKSNGAEVVKRVMPRQNESVNEIWICDKGRFAHAFAGRENRLRKPLIRKDGKLEETNWEEALAAAVRGLQAADSEVIGIAGGRASNEDLFNFRGLIEGLNGKAYLHGFMAGGDLIQKVGVGSDTDLSRLGKGDAILVVACDLQEEAPIWWLRVKRAADRGAALIVANARKTRLDKYASISLFYRYGEAIHTLLGILHAITEDPAQAQFGGKVEFGQAGNALKEAKHAVIFYGAEGLDFEDSEILSKVCAHLLASSGHVGKANDGLIAVWPHSNDQGAWDMGLRPPGASLGEIIRTCSAVYILAADPFGDEPRLVERLPKGAFLVVQELFLTPTAKLADVVFPAQSFIERDGSYTSGERVVQRFFMGVKSNGESLPDWQILARLGHELGIELRGSSAAAVMRQIGEHIPEYARCGYPALAQVKTQWPPVGHEDLYFGGTAYKNGQGLGVRLIPSAEAGEAFQAEMALPKERPRKDGVLVVPITRLYDRGRTIASSKVLTSRLESLRLAVSPEDARKWGVDDGAEIEMKWDGDQLLLAVEIRADVPVGTALVPRGMGVPLQSPVFAVIKPVK
jgi:NADH-quinone oxidoreductase subunit G